MSSGKRPLSSRHPRARCMPVDTHWRSHEEEADRDHAGVALPGIADPGWMEWIEEQVRAQRATVATHEELEPPPPPMDDKTDPETQEDRREPMGPETESGRDRRHVLLASTGVGAALVLVALLALGNGVIGTGDDASRPAADSSRTARSTTSSPAADAATRPPSPPYALPADGQHSQIRVLATGELEVQQWVRRSAGLVQLRLAPPDGVEVTALAIAAGGHPVQAPSTLAGPTQVDFTSTRQVYLAYRLTGALDRVGDRALARATSIDLGMPGAADGWTIAFEGGSILSLACRTAIDVPPQPCGAAAGKRGWRVVAPIGARDLVVMAQLDLDPPS